jgi:hypothetical protein
MRVLGPDTALWVFRWDLIYLAGELAADKRQQVAALAPPVQAAVGELRVRRGDLEEKEDAEILALAILHRRDRTRDGIVIELGGVARATDKVVNATLFDGRSPAGVARLGYDAETREIERISGELTKLDDQHPLKLTYLPKLDDAQGDFVKAKASSDASALDVTLARSEMTRFKLSLDHLRLATHGQLVALLKDKAEADSFFRPSAAVPGEQDLAPVDVPKVQPGVPARPIAIEPTATTAKPAP